MSLRYLNAHNNKALSKDEKHTLAQLHASGYTKAYQEQVRAMHPASLAPQDPTALLKEAQNGARLKGQSSGYSAASRGYSLKTIEALEILYLAKNNNANLSKDDNRTIAQLYTRAYTIAYQEQVRAMHPASLAPQDPTALLKEAQNGARLKGQSSGYSAASRGYSLKTIEALEILYLAKNNNTNLS
ncbi:MAG TPA: hypothetical protein PLV25_06570, partial [Opitutales bacterium]|nr:hypothetical protein [Opitutales bacterium]